MSVSERRQPVLAWFLRGVVLAILVAGIVVAGLTQTTWGRERVLALTLSTLSTRVNGTLIVDRLEGNLLTGARLYGVAIRGEDGEPLLLADSAYVNYELPSLIGGDMVLHRVVLYDSEVGVRRLPGDTLWNYEQIFPDTSDQPGGRATLIDAARLVDSRIVVRLPWEPDSTLSTAEQEAEVEEALADTSRLMVRRVPGGFLRTMRFEVAEAEIPGLVSAPDERGGLLLRVDRLTALAYVYRDPIHIQQLEGKLGLREGLVQFRASPVLLPDSRFAMYGTIDLTGDEPRYDLVVEGEQLAFSDLQWLYPPLPEQGGGELWLSLETRPEGLLYRVQSLRLEAPGTEITGELGILVGDTVRILDADLSADPLNVETIEQILPASIPIEGLHIGAAAVGDPAS
jgi:hypothetical protein